MRWIPDSAIEHLRTLDGLPELVADRYEIRHRIGEGGMGAVFSALDRNLGREVALKVLDVPDRSGELAARLLREAHVLAQLEHPGVVPVHDVGELGDGRLFYTMKLVRGHRLDRYLVTRRSLAEILRVFLRICEAVAFAHDRKVLHRDLKPANIMVGAFGEVLVMDWGVAKILSSAAPSDGVNGAIAAEDGREGSEPTDLGGTTVPTGHGVVLGTPGYMAPEQARGEIDGLDVRADVYSLGAVLRFMLAGRAEDSEATTLTFASEPSPAKFPMVGLPKRLVAIVRKAMAEHATERYDRVGDLAADIERFMDGRTVEALPESLWVRTGRFLSKHRVAVILILAYVLARTFVLVFLGR